MRSVATTYEEWCRVNEEMKRECFTWGALPENGEEHQYAALDVLIISKSRHELIKEASSDIFHVMQKTVHLLQSNQAVADLLGLSHGLWSCVRMPSQMFSYFTRLDLVVRGTQIKLLEVNCDTPTGFLEASMGNRIITEHFGFFSPNLLESAVKKAFDLIQQHYGPSHILGRIFFTSYDWHEEDKQTTEFIRRHSGYPDTEYIGLKDIVVRDTGLYTPDGRRIMNLYRLYPLEYMADPKNHRHPEIAEKLLDHIATGKVRLINPPSAFLGQMKTTMAVIWALHEENHPFFTKREHRIIEKYFLPTYVEPEPLIERGAGYVSKPILGREGGGITIFAPNGQVIAQDTTDEYFRQNKVFQQYVEMPKCTITTWDGTYTGSLLTGSFVIGGEPAGLFMRVGTEITGNLSMFLPVAVKDEPQGSVCSMANGVVQYRQRWKRCLYNST